MKISIITVNYNNLEGLKKTASSVIGQTWIEKEWIVIDGKSTDGSFEFLKSLESNIAYLCCERDSGVYNAMNKGIQHATGDYLIFMNSGDCFYNKEVIENVFSLQYQADVIYGDWIQLHENREVKLYAPKELSFCFIIRDNICHQAIFVKRELLQECGYDENYKLYADWAKWIELTLKGCTFQYVPVTICYYEMGGISCQWTEVMAKEMSMLKEKAIPKTMQNILGLLDELNLYRGNKILSETNMLIHERKLYRKLIHCNVRFVKFLSRIIG